MAEVPGSKKRTASAPGTDALAERVRQRLTLAGVAFDRRTAAARPAARRRKAPRAGEQAPGAAGDAQHARERACLRAVFHELGEAHRAYRARTGQSVTPPLRAATSAFKLEPSLVSLVPVAAFLDELDILAW
jgi:hypothetical protein